MPSNKSSKKPAKAAEKAAVPNGETSVSAELQSAPRSAKSAKAKSEIKEMTSGKQHRKVTTSAVVEPPARSETPGVAESKSLSDTPSRTVQPGEIAELAYSYFAERGHTHGSAEEDWLRAEKALAAAG